MSKITLYDLPDFDGECKQFDKNEPDLAEMIFNNVAQSARVEGLHWVAFADKNYRGEFFVLGPGDHRTLGPNFNKKLSSLRLVSEDLMAPEIELYEDVDYCGNRLVVTEKVDDLERADMNNLVSSDIVKRGVWILYTGVNQTGSRAITFKGDKWPNYTTYGWKNKLSSLRPLVNSDCEVGPYNVKSQQKK